MKNDKLGFNNTVNLKKFDNEGMLLSDKTIHNRTQTETINGICDMLVTGTVTNYTIAGMAIGTGDNAAVSATTLIAKVSDEAISSGSGVTDNATSVTAIATFTNATGGSWVIEEAGIGGDASVATHMLFYACKTIDSLDETLNPSDTLQITWTITPADS